MKHAPLTLKAMKQKKYLDLYYEWMETRRLPGSGLCGSNVRDVKLFQPTCDEYLAFGAMKWQAWGYDGELTANRGLNIDSVLHNFTPLRQTIILFLAAKNNEL